MAHDFGKVSVRGFHKKVIVIIHQAISVNCCSVPFGCGFEIGEKFFPIPVVFKYLFLFVSPGGNDKKLLDTEFVMVGPWSFPHFDG